MVQNASFPSRLRSWHAGFLFVSLDSISLESFLFFSSGPPALLQPGCLPESVHHQIPPLPAFVPAIIPLKSLLILVRLLFPLFSFHYLPLVRRARRKDLQVLCADNRLKTFPCFEIWSNGAMEHIFSFSSIFY